MSETRTVLERALAEMRRRALPRKMDDYFLDEGPFRRALYPKHIEFFAAGARFKERLFMAANRVGKSDAGAFEVTCHATGIYPAGGPAVGSPSLSKFGRAEPLQRPRATSSRKSWSAALMRLGQECCRLT